MNKWSREKQRGAVRRRENSKLGIVDVSADPENCQTKKRKKKKEAKENVQH